MNDILSRKGLRVADLHPLGSMNFEVFGKEITFVGGPYLAKPKAMLGVKMAAEIEADCHWDVPTKDFSVPPMRQMDMALLQSIAHAYWTGQKVYVGCMAGRGRTGLFMASVAFVLGDENPVRRVRDEYYPHAVETDEQEAFVEMAFSREKFRKALAKLLVDTGRISFRNWRVMPWSDKKLFVRIILAKAFRRIIG